MDNNGGRKNSRKGKGKMKEFEISPPPPLPPQMNFTHYHGGSLHHFASPINDASAYSKVQQILNDSTAAPFNSFTALLAAAAASQDDSDVSTDVENPIGEIDRIITSHCENLRHALAGTWGGAAEGAAAKKLMEREMELTVVVKEREYYEKRAEHFKAEAERLSDRARSLKEKLTAARRRCAAETAEEEDAESSYVDPGRVAPLTLDCKSCRRRRATVMVWPCRHVSVCTVCEAATRSCPVCRSLKTDWVEVRLPFS